MDAEDGQDGDEDDRRSSSYQILRKSQDPWATLPCNRRTRILRADLTAVQINKDITPIQPGRTSVAVYAKRNGADAV